MKEEFEIYGNHIPFSLIKDYRVVQREYIYRPFFREKQTSLMKLISSQKYEFVEMIPYAAVLSENEYKAAVNENNNGSIVRDNYNKNPAEIVADVCLTPVNFVKDVTVSAFSTLFSNSPFTNQQKNKYYCINISGRVFETYLDDIPVVLSKLDGRVFDIAKDDPSFTQLGDNVKAFITEVTAFIIEADKKYLFFGDGIQLDDANKEYSRLRNEIEEYKRTNN